MDPDACSNLAFYRKRIMMKPIMNIVTSAEQQMPPVMHQLGLSKTHEWLILPRKLISCVKLPTVMPPLLQHFLPETFSNQCITHIS
jgi:hypothetical protein